MRKNRKLLGVSLSVLIGCVLLAVSFSTQADNFTKTDLERWDKEFMAVVMKGEKLFHSALGSNKVSCDQCHPNAANTHPETYPKFQQQLGKVTALRDMINWCIMNPLEGEPLDLDSREMIAIESYVYYERRGVELAPGKH